MLRANLLRLAVFAFPVAALTANLSAQQSASGEVLQLDPFTITTDTNAGYRPTQTSALTRTNRELIDLPQSIDILSEEFLKDTSTNQMDEAFVYVSNAQVRNSSAGTSPNNILVRGFSNGSSFTDGIETGGYYRDMFGYERMEVIKGPASAVQGRGTDSGYINFVLKKPLQGANFTRVSLGYEVGTHGKDGKRATIDHNFTLSKDKGLYARVAAVWDNHDSYIDFLDYKTVAVYPSLRWVASEKTDIVVVGEFMDSKTPAREPGHGFAWMPALYRKTIPIIGDASDPITALNLPTNFNIGGPQRGADNTVANVVVIGTHKFSDSIQYRQALSYMNSFRDAEWWDAEANVPTPVSSISAAFKNDPATHYDPNGIYIPVQQGYTNSDSYRFNLQSDLNIKYSLGPVNFVSLVGFAYKDTTDTSVNHAGTIPTRYSFINLKEPENAWVGRDIVPGSRRVSTNRDSRYKEFGYYIQQDMNLFHDRLLLSGGYRRDTGESWSVNYLTNTTADKIKTTVNSWRVAGTYKVNDSFSLYAIKSTQNNPTVTGVVWSDLLPGDPRLNEMLTRTPTTELTEYGFKGYLFEKRVTYTFSWFEIVTGGQVGNDRVDTTSQAPGSLGTPVLSALKRFVTNGDLGKGIEVSLFGQITPKWDVNLAWGTLNTEQPITGGSRDIRHSPEYNASVFSKYKLYSNSKSALSVRGGISAIGPFVQQVGGALSRVYPNDEQWRADLGLNYRFGKHSIDLIAKNVTNRPYIVTRTNPPRQIRLTYSTEF